MKENKKVQHNLDLSGKTIVNARLVNCKITLDDGTVVTLAEILSAIVDAMPSGETPRPIVLTAMPEDGDTVETLAEKGLTVDEIIAASRGERTAVVLSTDDSTLYYEIFTAFDRAVRSITFGVATYNVDGTFINLTQYIVSITPDNSVTVDFVEL